MRTNITIADLVRCGACSEGFATLLPFLEKQNIPSDGTMEFDEVIDLFNANKLRPFSMWLQSRRAELLEYQNVIKTRFLLNHVEYETLEEVQLEIEKQKAERRKYHLGLTSVGFTESVGEDQAWKTIDIDSFVIPDECQDFHFHIFNHQTGLHIEAYSIEEALAVREQLINKFMQDDENLYQIVKREYFEEFEGSYKDIVL